MTVDEIKSFEEATEDFLANSTCISEQLEIDSQSVTAKVENQNMVDSNLRVQISIDLKVPDRANLSKKEVKEVVVKCIEDNFSDWTDQLSITSSYFQELEQDSNTGGIRSVSARYIILVVLSSLAVLAAMSVLYVRRVKGKKLRLMKEKFEEEGDDKHDISVIELFNENFEPRIKSFSFVTATDSGGDGTDGESGDVKVILSQSNASLERSDNSTISLNANEKSKDKTLEEETNTHVVKSEGENSPQIIRAPLEVNLRDDVLLETRSIPECFTFDDQSDQDETNRTQTTSYSSVFGLNISVGALEESRKRSVLEMIETERIQENDFYVIKGGNKGMGNSIPIVNDELEEILMSKADEMTNSQLREVHATPEKIDEKKSATPEKTDGHKDSSLREEHTTTQASQDLFVISSSSEEETDFFSEETNLNALIPDNYISWADENSDAERGSI